MISTCLLGHLRPTPPHELDTFSVSQVDGDRAGHATPPPPRYSPETLVDLRGWGMVTMGVRMFFIAIAVLAVAAVAFLIATA
jgi:hypothetical protein